MAIDYTSDLGKLRLLIGDNTEPYYFSDDQLNAFLDIYGSYKNAIIPCLETLSIQLIKESGDDYRIGDIEYTEGRSKAQQLLGIINDRKSSIANGLDTMFLGIGKTKGIYVADTESRIDRTVDGEINAQDIYDDTFDIYNYDNQNGPYN